MPYTDWNYTNPGWTNENPPAINESNLNDISNALSKLNLTSEQLNQLGLTTANGLGDIISKLVENIDEKGIGDVCIYQYVYVGTMGNQVSINLNIPDYYNPHIAIVYQDETPPDFGIMFKKSNVGFENDNLSTYPVHEFTNTKLHFETVGFNGYNARYNLIVL